MARSDSAEEYYRLMIDRFLLCLFPEVRRVNA